MDFPTKNTRTHNSSSSNTTATTTVCISAGEPQQHRGVSRLRRVLSSIRIGKSIRTPTSHIFTPRPKKTARSLTSSAYAQSTALPYLPPELWVLILRHATVPYTLSACPTGPRSDTDPYPVCEPCSDPDEPVSFLRFPHSHSHLSQRLALYSAAMRFKASLRLVCRAWNAVGEEVLYESVWISSMGQAGRLAGVLRGFEKEKVAGEAQGWEEGKERSPGRFMRRLHIETPTMERCCPSDLRVILDHAPRLTVYSDYRSIRRLPPTSQLHVSPEQMLGALAHPGNRLRRLSWTNYEYDAEDYDGGVSFYVRVVSPMLYTTAAHLEFLELNFCSRHLHSPFVVPTPSSSASSTTSGSSSALTAEFLTSNNLTLPALRSLKVTLDNATFFVLSTWSMPRLQNLSVLSADFSYANSGFAAFFLVHGRKLTQLELGHSSGAIEEHNLTAPAAAGIGHIPLSDWCPNLREFICSADAEWNWQSPDWIAPHVLLPAHEHLEFIGVRDMEKRLLDDLRLSQDRLREGSAGEEQEEDAFFMLEEQMGSLLRKEAFPNLLYVRDMSWGSDIMRRKGRVWADPDGELAVVPSTVSPFSSSHLPTPRSSGPHLASMIGSLGREDKEARRRRREEEEADQKSKARGKMLLRFWRRVLERCRERGVWLEDCRGVNITMGDLRRAEAA